MVERTIPDGLGMVREGVGAGGTCGESERVTVAVAAKVYTESAPAKSQIFTVLSPEAVAKCDPAG